MRDFSIKREPTTGLLRITLSGFWDATTTAAFERSLREVLRTWPKGSRSVLVDARGHGVQSQEVMGRFKDIVAEVRQPATRVAVLVGSALGRLQAQRVEPHAAQRLFTSEPEALSWLAAAESTTLA